MRESEEFLSLLAEIKKRYFFGRLERFLLVFLLLLLLSLFVFQVGRLFLTGLSMNPGVLGTCLLVAIFFSITFILITRKSVKEVLIELDSRFDLEERLITTYEYEIASKNSLYKTPLIRDAISSIRSVEPHLWFPRGFTPVFPAILIIGVLLSASLYYNSLPDKRLKSMASPTSQSINLSKKNQETSLQKKQNKNRTGFKEFIQSLEESGIDSKEARQSLEEILKRVAADTDHVIDQIKENLARVKPTEVSITEGLKEDIKNSSDPEQILDSLEQFLDNSQNSELKDSIKQLSELSDMKDFLEEAISELELHEPYPPNENREQQDSPENEWAASEEDGSADVTKGEDRQDSKLILKKTAGDETKGLKLDDENKGPQTGASNKVDPEFSTAPGKAKSDWEENHGGEMQANRSPVRKLEGKTGEGERYQALVRSLTAKGYTGRVEEELLRSYEKDVTSVIQREEIPLHYRNYIKQYFLSIGLVQETTEE